MNISKGVRVRAEKKKIGDLKPGDIFIDDLMPKEVIILIDDWSEHGEYRGASLNYRGAVYEYSSEDVVHHLQGTLSVT